MASRILGMGDMLTLIEKAQKDFDEEQAQKTVEKMRENSFDFNDFLDQMAQMQKMGSMEDIMKMIPGMANNPALKNANIDPKDMEHLKAIVYSMTPAERENPDLLNPSRRRRLAAGSGRPIVEVNRMIKQFNQMKKMMKQVSNGNMSGLENMMGGSMPGGRLGKLAMNRMSRQMKKNKKKRAKKNKKRR
jgi:signal recognition particle subunit SRP54